MTQLFSERLKNVNPQFLTFDSLKTLQVNLGNLCNMACVHCHVSASPAGEKQMSRAVAEKIVAVLQQPHAAVDQAAQPVQVSLLVDGHGGADAGAVGDAARRHRLADATAHLGAAGRGVRVVRSHDG